jgi:hypothetical protein
MQPTPGEVQSSHHNMTVVEHFVEQVSNRPDGVQSEDSEGPDGNPALVKEAKSVSSESIPLAKDIPIASRLRGRWQQRNRLGNC